MSESSSISRSLLGNRASAITTRNREFTKCIQPAAPGSRQRLTEAFWEVLCAVGLQPLNRELHPQLRVVLRETASLDAVRQVVGVRHVLLQDLHDLCDLHTAIAHGIGEQLENVELPPSWFCVIHPGEHVSTAKIFTHPDLKRDTPKLKADWQTENLGNDCEALVKKLCPEVEKALQWLLKYAPSKMTGTGACCFAEFSTEAQAQQVLAQLPEKWTGFVASSATLSPAHTALNAHFEMK